LLCCPTLGNHVAMVNSACIVEGEDDLFGEDDHMAHHYNTTVYFKVAYWLRCCCCLNGSKRTGTPCSVVWM
jgi:hypothetical protein